VLGTFHCSGDWWLLLSFPPLTILWLYFWESVYIFHGRLSLCRIQTGFLFVRISSDLSGQWWNSYITILLIYVSSSMTDSSPDLFIVDSCWIVVFVKIAYAFNYKSRSPVMVADYGCAWRITAGCRIVAYKLLERFRSSDEAEMWLFTMYLHKLCALEVILKRTVYGILRPWKGPLWCDIRVMRSRNVIGGLQNVCLARPPAIVVIVVAVDLCSL